MFRLSLAVLASYIFCVSNNVLADQVLVLLSDPSLKSSHSLYFTSLRDRGYELDYKLFTDTVAFRNYDDWQYDKAIIMAKGGADLGGGLTVPGLLEFVDDGNDLVLALDSAVSEEFRDLAAELGVDVEPAGSVVKDFSSHDVVKGPSVVAASDVFQSNAVFDKPVKGAVLFEGVGLTVPQDSELVFRGLVAPPTAFCSSPSKTELVAGKELVLVALVQARNNARAVVSGSIALFSNAFFSTPVLTKSGQSAVESGNLAFWEGVSRWGFHERGVIEATHLRHRLEEGAQQSIYRVNDHVIFEVDIHQKLGRTWQPYIAEDVQVELVMMDPYVRQFLQHDNKGHYSVNIHVPDVYGVFKFVLDYKRPGWSYIHQEHQVPIRPYRHNEYERFILSAYPYYASAFSMMAGFFILGFFVLYAK